MPVKSTNSRARNDRRLKWGDGWIEERRTAAGDMRYMARWREPREDGASAFRARTFRSLSAAEHHLRDLADRRAAGDPRTPDRATVAGTVAAFLERGRHRWKPATYATYRQRAETHIVPHLGKTYITHLTAPRVQAWIDGLVAGQLAPETIESAVRVLLGACRDAVMLGMIAANPVSGTRRPSLKVKPVAVWTAEESRKVLTVAAGDPMWHAAYALALATGMRPGELRVIRWSDVELDRGVVFVRRTMTKDAEGHQVIGETTKTGKVRAIALAAPTVAILRRWRTAQLTRRLAATEWGDGDLTFTTANGRLISQRHWQDKHDALIAAAGVPRVPLHSMRHTAATLMLERGVPAKVVSEILGHSTVAFTQDRYQHVDERMQRRAVDDIAALLDTGTDATT